MIFGIGLFRIAKYLWVGCTWLSFIPVVNLIYLCAVTDKLNAETYGSEWTMHLHIEIASIILALFGYLLEVYTDADITIIAGWILLFTGIVAAIANTTIAYFSIICECLPWFCGLLPPMLLLASYRLEAHYDSDVDIS